MLERIVDSYFIYYMLGLLAVVGIFSRVIRNIALKRLLMAAGNIAKSNHSFMRLIKAKYEHACMISDKVDNTEVFVDKYMHEYKACGVMLHTWTKCENIVIGLETILTAFAVYGVLKVHGITTISTRLLLQYSVMGMGVILILLLMKGLSDEKYRLNAIHIYIVDYLENVYAHRFAKTYSREARESHTAEIQIPSAVQPQVVQAANIKGIQEIEKPGLQKPELQKQKEPEPEIPEPAKDIPEIPKPVRTTTDLPYTTPKEPLKEATGEMVKEENSMPREDVIRNILAEYLA